MPFLSSPSVPLHPQQIPDVPQCTPSPMRIIHIGMGASGLLFAHKVQKYLQGCELVCYEKNDAIGGTWYENKYPGCACDIPAHTYTFPWYPNPEWSGYYSYSDEIQAYFSRFAQEHDVEKYAVLNTEVTSCEWNGDKWIVNLKRSDGSFHADTCDVLVNGTGIINKWKWPDIAGLKEFQGTLAHSANWPKDLDWKGKRVGVIGTGSSSIQMVPQFSASAQHLTVFMRNQAYIGPQIGSSVSNKEADPDAMEPEAAGRHTYTAKEKQRFRDDPEYHLKYRRTIEKAVVSGFRAFYRGSTANITARNTMQAAMASKLSAHPELTEKFIPSWSPGCRRLTPGEGYLEALVAPNVTTTFSDILKITHEGVLTADGVEHKFDILVCATGFHVQYMPHFQISGIDGAIMQEQQPEVYASIAVPGYPNYFVVNGPRGNWGQGCALPSHDVQADYIIQCCLRMRQDKIKTMVPKQNVTAQMNRYMDAWHKKYSVWSEDCRSWYKDNKPDGRVYIWPGSLYHHLKFMKRPRFEHFEIEYREPDNIFSFLGNGLTITEEKFGDDMPVPYVRNAEDEPWEIE